MKKTLVLLTRSLVIMAAMHWSSPMALALPTNGLVAWWQGEGNANDAVGVNHGTLVGGVRFAPGKVGQAFRLNGVNAYVDLGTALDVPSWPNYAVSLWFQHDGGGLSDQSYGQKIIDKTVFFHDFYISVLTRAGVPTSGDLHFQTYEGEGDAMVDMSHDYRDKTWHHVVINKSGSDGEMWIDGTLVDTSTNVRTVLSDGKLLLGYSLSPDSLQRRYFSGLIDDVGIYNRPLTAAEIADIWNASLVCDGLHPTIIGTNGNDVLIGTEGDDVIVGLGGDDIIYGRGGHDVICGGSGNDVLWGGSGRDRLFGEAGDDVLQGGSGADYLAGGPGRDMLMGGAGNDRLFGEDGDDVLHGGDGVDRLVGGPGRDTLFGGPGNDRLFGGGDTDYLHGGADDDALNGGSGSDVCDGGLASTVDTADASCETVFDVP